MGSQISKDTIISASALTVALMVLVIATARLLGRYFATADGYRRCQASMMGAWARHTRLKWTMVPISVRNAVNDSRDHPSSIRGRKRNEHLPMPTQNRNLKWIASPESPTAR